MGRSGLGRGGKLFWRLGEVWYHEVRYHELLLPMAEGLAYARAD